MSWINNIDTLYSILKRVEVTDCQRNHIDVQDAFTMLKKATIDVRIDQAILYLIGNGASSSMASHVSADLAKNADVHTQVFTDLSLLTAMSNDISYDQVYSCPLNKRAKGNDMLVAISSSGESRNIINAVNTALEKQLMVVTFSAMSVKNQLRQMGHLNFYITTETYGMAETGHNALLHYWIDLITGDICE